MSGIITDRRKVISLGVIVPNARDRIPVAFAQPFLEVGVRGSVRLVVDASPQPRPSLDERDLQAGLGQHKRSDPAARTTTDNADVVDHLIPPPQSLAQAYHAKITAPRMVVRHPQASPNSILIWGDCEPGMAAHIMSVAGWRLKYLLYFPTQKIVA
jgi:hypothetical protein